MVASRRAWIEAALEALGDKGVSNVKVEALASTLGVTKGSFYHHFSNTWFNTSLRARET